MQVNTEALLLPWRVESDSDYTCITNDKGMIVVPAGSGAPAWMNSEWPTENEVNMIVQAVNEHQSLLDRIAELEAQLVAKDNT